MGKEEETKERLRTMAPYQVTAPLFAAAKRDAYFLHCLPAHAGEEVTEEVLANPRSVIFDQAENRLHVQKAILTMLARSARR
jgi:ornithine carbamoyltransferase